MGGSPYNYPVVIIITHTAFEARSFDSVGISS